MTTSRWRKVANEVIAKVASENPGLPEKELRKKLSGAYPFGWRGNHPYSIWLSAVKEHFEPRQPRERHQKVTTVNEGQLMLSMGDDNE